MDLTVGGSNVTSKYEQPHDQHPFLRASVHETRDPTKIQAYLQSLNDELRKIEAFKRELPICMQLLSSEIETSKMQLYRCRCDDTYRDHLSLNATEFSELKSRMHMSDYIISKILHSLPEEANCARCAGDRIRPPSLCLHKEENTSSEDQEEVSDIASKLYNTRTMNCNEDSHFGNTDLGTIPGGAFTPFKDKKRKLMDKADRTTIPSLSCHQAKPYGPNWSSSTSIGAEREEASSHQHASDQSPCHGAHVTQESDGILSNQQSPHRKPRRCWSPELHCKFVNALKQLGGSEGNLKLKTLPC
ncbi:hypothetical protein KP509_19G044500 [Ceratopteris richardii]|uniref:HHO5-like N-terminal domain-containing protein n=1 Tax=Ceratopteris richardii TaxID=49495 RepID=A0A8T2SM09_CERRI|nr:hypothetical protein KP509_19G044500 [Ceratopteris richardii]